MTHGVGAVPETERIAWGRRKRLEFIEFRLLWDGRINRADLSNAFDMSDQQASSDIAAYEANAPGNLVYDVRQRAYLRGVDFQPRFVAGLTDRYLLQLTAVLAGQIAKSETYFGELLPSKVALLPHIPTKWETVMWIARAVRQKKEIEIDYSSLSDRAKRKRKVAPHALGFGSGGWHMRAWSRDHNDFRFYKFDRIYGVKNVGDSSVNPDWDRAWHEKFTLMIAPNHNLSTDAQKAVAAEHHMTKGILKHTLPIALCFYLINDLGLDLARKVVWGDGKGKTVPPQRLQLVLENWDDFLTAEARTRKETKDLLLTNLG